MPVYLTTNVDTIVAGGGTINWIMTGSPANNYEIRTSGTITLSSSQTFGVTGTPVLGVTFPIRYYGRVNLGGNNITILGRALTQEEAINDWTGAAYYNGTSWEVDINLDDPFAGDGYKGLTTTTVPGAGGTVTLNPRLHKINQRYTGNANVTSNYTITGVTTSDALDGDEFFILWDFIGTFTAANVTIFGITLAAGQDISGAVLVRAVYDAANTTWLSSLIEGDAYNNFITNTLLAQMPALTVKCNPTNALANPQDLQASVADTVLQRDAGTSLLWSKVSDAQLATVPALTVKCNPTNSTAALQNLAAASASTVLKRNAANALVFAKVDNVDLATMPTLTLKGNNTGISATPIDLTVTQVQTMLGVIGTGLLSASVTIPTADVLTLNSSPVTLVAAPSAGFYIDVISATVNLTFNTTPYATNTVLTIGYNTAVDGLVEDLDVLIATTTVRRKIHTPCTISGTTATQIIDAADLILYTLTGDPTAGDSDIEVHLIYRVVPV